MSFLTQIEHLLSLHPSKLKRSLPSITGIWQNENSQIILSKEGLFKLMTLENQEGVYGTFYFRKPNLVLNEFGQESKKHLIEKFKKQKYFHCQKNIYEYKGEAVFTNKDQRLFIEYNDLEKERIAIAYRMVKLLNNMKF